MRSAQQLVSAWAPSTISTYNAALTKVKVYCVKNNVPFLSIRPHVFADYLCVLSDSSDRPKASLNTTVAAMTCFAQATGIANPVTPEINRLLVGLVKSGTRRPMQRSSAMPVDPFMDLFRSWPGNYRLTLKQLRLKVLTLLALVIMLRPSDVAPKAKVYDSMTKKLVKTFMRTDQVRFLQDGSMKIVLHGIKNDYHRDGFEVLVNPASDPQLDPVRAMQLYIQRTAHIRPISRPLFLSLKSPYGPISSDTVSSVLEEAITSAGLAAQGFTAKSFRPTGATRAIEGQVVSDTVRKVGRWKSRETFEEHYVHSRPPRAFTDVVLDIGDD